MPASADNAKQQLLLLLSQTAPDGEDGGGEDALRPQISELVAEMHHADIADALESLPPAQRPLVWSCAAEDARAEALLELSDAARLPLLSQTPEAELAGLLQRMPADEVAGMLREVPAAVCARLLRLAGLSANPQLRASLAFEDGTVGALMDFDAVIVRETDSIGELRARLQTMGELPSHCDKLFVADGRDRLTGVLPLKLLLLNPPECLAREVMVAERLHFFQTDDDIEKAAGAFERYDMISAPVLDGGGKIAGRITVDEILDHLQERQSAGLLSSAGVGGDEDLLAPPFRRFANRWRWLLVNLLAVFVISLAVGLFESVIAQLAALAALMPIVASMSGNAGNQTATLTVRALAQEQINALNWRTIARGEALLSLLNGAVWGAAAGVFAYWAHGRLDLSLVLAGSMVACFLAAALSGFFFPLLMKKIGKDPALGASVVLTSVVDTLGFLIFLTLGAIFLF